MKSLSVLVMCATLLGVALSPFLPTPTRAAVLSTTLNGHNVVVEDGSQRLLSWVQPQDAAYDTVVRNSWTWIFNRPPGPTGLPDYYLYSSLDPDLIPRADSPNNPAGKFAMLVESALASYPYSGDGRAVTVARNVLDHQLANGLTPATWSWASVPYASADPGATTFAGAQDPNGSGRGDGVGVIEPDKVGEFGLQLLRMYQHSGDVRYRDAAIAAADALAAHVRPGDSTRSPWPFRVFAETDVVVEEYCACTIKAIELFDELIRLALGNGAAYQAARGTAWNWLLAFPLQNNRWANYFEDVDVDPSQSNFNQLVAGETAKYLLNHPELDPNWEAHVRGIVAWVEGVFGKADFFGARPIGEQVQFNIEMGSHTARYGAINARLYELTGDVATREKAFRALNWATYMNESSGVTRTGPTYQGIWFTDGYGDYIKHFIQAMGSVPEWAPSSDVRVLRSSSVTRAISYTSAQISYTTFDGSAVDVVRVLRPPAQVTAGGVALSQVPTLTQDGWTYDSATQTLRIRRSSPSVVISCAAGDCSSTGGSSLSLNGTSAYAEAPHGAELASTGDWTVEAWFKDETPGGYNHGRTRIIAKGDTNVAGEVPFFMDIQSNRLWAGRKVATGSQVVSTDLSGVSSGTWHHAAATFRASNFQMTLYLDGVQVAQGTTGTVSPGNTAPVSIGRNGGPSSGNFWRGKLDDVRIWNVVRAAAEIQSNIGSELGTAPAGLVGNWRFNEGAGATAADVAGVAPQNATLLGAAAWAADVHP